MKTIKTDKITIRVASIIFRLFHSLLWPIRLTGLLGIKAMPIEFCAGDKLPFWINLYYPRCAALTFDVDVDCYFSFRLGSMVLEAYAETGQTIATLRPTDGLFLSGVIIVGAPNVFIYNNAGKRKRRFAERLATVPAS